MAEIYYGKVKSLRKIITTALLIGISGSLLFFSILMIVGITDKTYQWSIAMLLGSFAFSLIPGLILFLGVLWSFFALGKYREILLRKLTRKPDENEK